MFWPCHFCSFASTLGDLVDLIAHYLSLVSIFVSAVEVTLLPCSIFWISSGNRSSPLCDLKMVVPGDVVPAPGDRIIGDRWQPSC